MPISFSRCASWIRTRDVTFVSGLDPAGAAGMGWLRAAHRALDADRSPARIGVAFTQEGRAADASSDLPLDLEICQPRWSYHRSTSVGFLLTVMHEWRTGPHVKSQSVLEPLDFCGMTVGLHGGPLGS
jgi:hypothetical protein